jgi:hypothetical protein
MMQPKRKGSYPGPFHFPHNGYWLVSFSYADPPDCGTSLEGNNNHYISVGWFDLKLARE